MGRVLLFVGFTLAESVGIVFLTLDGEILDVGINIIEYVNISHLFHQHWAKI